MSNKNKKKMSKEKRKNKKSQIKLLGILSALALNSSEIINGNNKTANETFDEIEDESNETIIDELDEECFVLIDNKEISYEDYLIKLRVDEIRGSLNG